MAEKWDHRGILASDHDVGGPNSDHRNSSNMFSGKFPEGLRVLVFDEDPQHLLIVEKHLQEFQYEVSRCYEEEKAMYLLRNHRNRFDIAIIEAQHSNGERFRLISEIASEMDLPIIIISKDDSIESVINWMRNGACDYLIKPIRPEDLRLIFKHVAKKIQVRSVAVVAGDPEETAAAAEKSSSVGDSTIKNSNKRKRSSFLDEEENDHDRDRDSTSKKRRVVWDDELHKKFIDAVEYLGTQKAVPKKILERMNVDGITRENVASHLQKFRMSLKKRNDQNEKEQRSLITSREGGMYSGEGGRNVQFPTHDINNIPQPSSVQQQQSTNPNFMTQLISPLGHHHHGVSVGVSGRNLVMTHQHQHHHHHQTPEFACIESAEGSMVYNEDEAGVENLTWLFTQNSEEMSLFHLQEPVMATTMLPNDNHVSANPQQTINVHETHEPSMLHIPSFPTSFTHSSFLDDQKETITMVDVSRGFNYNNGYSVNNNRLT